VLLDGPGDGVEGHVQGMVGHETRILAIGR
jgi:hypothetical protein